MTDPSYPEGAPVQVHVDRSKPGIIAAASATIRVVVNTSTEALSFFDVSTGSRILGDLEHSFTGTTDPGDKSTDPVFVVEQSWEQTQGALYGGGEFQSGILDFTGAPVELVQFNTEAIIPFFVSTQGYGLLWDNPAWTMLNPPSQNPLLTVPRARPTSRSRRLGPAPRGATSTFSRSCAPTMDANR